jgi:hypothetical protein
MGSAGNWFSEQKALIEELKSDVKKWRDTAKKENLIWREDLAQEIKDWKESLIEEVKAVKKEVKDGNKGIAREGAGTTDILGSPIGESDQAETDDNIRRKRRSSTTGSN